MENPIITLVTGTMYRNFSAKQKSNRIKNNDIFHFDWLMFIIACICLFACRRIRELREF